MKLILETTDINVYLYSFREYYPTENTENIDEELIVLRDRHGVLQDWVHTLSCAERCGIVQRDEEDIRIIVGYNRTMNPFRLTKVTRRF